MEEVALPHKILEVESEETWQVLEGDNVSEQNCLRSYSTCYNHWAS